MLWPQPTVQTLFAYNYIMIKICYIEQNEQIKFSHFQLLGLALNIVNRKIKQIIFYSLLIIQQILYYFRCSFLNCHSKTINLLMHFSLLTGFWYRLTMLVMTALSESFFINTCFPCPMYQVKADFNSGLLLSLKC